MNNFRVFVEFTSFIKKEVISGKLLFKLLELHSLYENRLESLGHRKSVNQTRMRERFLKHFQEAQEQSDGNKNTILVFKEGMRNMLKEALKKRHFSEDVDILARAASIVRKDIFGYGLKFDESFPQSVKKRHYHRVSKP